MHKNHCFREWLTTNLQSTFLENFYGQLFPHSERVRTQEYQHKLNHVHSPEFNTSCYQCGHLYDLAAKLIVEGLYLSSQQLVRHNSEPWMKFILQTTADKCVLQALAHILVTENKENDDSSIWKILQLIGSVGFTLPSILKLASLIRTNKTYRSTSNSEQWKKREQNITFSKSDVTTFLLMRTQTERIESLLTKMKEEINPNAWPASSLVEMYEYKIDALMMSLREADERNAACESQHGNAKHHIANLSLELREKGCLLTQQLLLVESQKEELHSLQKKLVEQNDEYKCLLHKSEREHEKLLNNIEMYKENTAQLEKRLGKQQEKLQKARNLIAQKEAAEKQMDEKYSQLLEDCRVTQCKLDACLVHATGLEQQNEHMKKQLSIVSKAKQELEEFCNSQTVTLAEKEKKNKEYKDELETLQRIRDAIHEMSGAKRRLN